MKKELRKEFIAKIKEQFEIEEQRREFGINGNNAQIVFDMYDKTYFIGEEIGAYNYYEIDNQLIIDDVLFLIKKALLSGESVKSIVDLIVNEYDKRTYGSGSLSSDVLMRFVVKLQSYLNKERWSWGWLLSEFQLEETQLEFERTTS